MHAGNQDNPLTWTVFIEMTHSETSHPNTGARRAFHGLSLLLVAMLILNDARGVPSIRVLVQKDAQPPKPGSSPYLSFVGPVPLRFAEPPLQPEPSAPAPVAPPPATPAVSDETFVEPLPASTSSPDAAIPPEPPEPREIPVKDPPRILLDDVRPAARPEEFLPYFQIPGGKQRGEVTIVAPVPASAPAGATIPPSSATYTQKP